MPPLRFFRSLLAQNLTPAVTYYVRGTSSNVNGTETFNIQYIADGASTPDPATTETVNVAADGSWEFSYSGKMIYSLGNFAQNNTRLTALDLSAADDLTELASASDAFVGCTHLAAINIGTYTWSVDVVLSACPITSASMLAFLGNFADYSQGAQHLVKISPYSAADMGANADTIKAAMSAKNWNLPLSQLGKYTRAELLTLINGGYIPIVSESEYQKIGSNSLETMGLNTEYENTYNCGDSSNYVIIHDFNVMSYATSKAINAILDGNLLKIDASAVDYSNGSFITTIGSDGIVRNMNYIGKIFAHNGCRSFANENNGTIENCVVDLKRAVGGSAYQYGFLHTNNGNISNILIRVIELNWANPDYYDVRRLFETNNGNIENISLIGTYRGPASTSNLRRQSFLRYNYGAMSKVIDNQLANRATYGVLYSGTGTLTDCYRNSDRLLTLGNATAKTTAELTADNIGSGMYANFSADIWKKDNDGFPTLKIADNIELNTNFTDISAYDALLAFANVIETQTISKTLTISATFWAGLTAAEQANIDSILSAKNWTRALA